MSINETVGQRIRAQREKLGLRQHDIANALQVSPQAVSKWERGENAPDISLLVPLAQLLGVSTDHLLGFHANQPDEFEATVCFAMASGYAAKAQTMPPKALAAWANGFFLQFTEAILADDGIPVKYMGDSFLGFFAGPDHQQRAVQAAFQARAVVSEPLTIALHSGEIYLGTIGHPDYSRPDIMGDTVNLTFMTLEWAARHRAGRLVVSAAVFQHVRGSVSAQPPHSIRLRGIENPVEMYDLDA